jgi:hypothetical protein
MTDTPQPTEDQAPSEMVKRVAYALASMHTMGAVYVGPDGSRYSEVPIDRWLRYARAAIETMSEPTKAMIMAGCKYDAPMTATYEETTAGQWRAMIEEALR